jgi:hypothetical protein
MVAAHGHLPVATFLVRLLLAVLMFRQQVKPRFRSANPITCGVLFPDLSADGTTQGRPGPRGHYLPKVMVFEG